MRDDNWLWTRSLVIFICLLIFFRLADASSAISSSEIIHLSMSFFKLVKGSIASNISSRLSLSASSSRREKVLTLKATFKRESILSNSPVPRVLPISNLLMDSPILWIPEKERLPFCQIRDKASPVCFWFSFISWISADGTSAWQSFLPGSEPAWFSNIFIIL